MPLSCRMWRPQESPWKYANIHEIYDESTGKLTITRNFILGHSQVQLNGISFQVSTVKQNKFLKYFKILYPIESYFIA